MATRIKKKVFKDVTAEQAQQASETFAQKFNALSKVEAKMNEEINKIKSKYQDQVTDLTEDLEEPKEILETYATEQKDNWGKKKSLELLHTTIGFRTGMPKLKPEKGWNWTSITEVLKEKFSEYVRTVTEPNKEKLIADREADGFEAICKKAHFTVVQDETFYVEPKVEELAATA